MVSLSYSGRANFTFTCRANSTFTCLRLSPRIPQQGSHNTHYRQGSHNLLTCLRNTFITVERVKTCRNSYLRHLLLELQQLPLVRRCLIPIPIQISCPSHRLRKSLRAHKKRGPWVLPTHAGLMERSPSVCVYLFLYIHGVQPKISSLGLPHVLPCNSVKS